MPQRVMCSECAHVLYEGDILRAPKDIAKKYEGRCPSCGKKLKTIIKSLSIYPYEEKDDK
jgi:NAD-dependent SIR2 family protein deacetylase